MSLLIRNLTYTKVKKDLLKDINIEAKSSEMIALIGPNGAGKSTLLKHISKILPIEKNTIYLEGVDIFDLEARELAKDLSYLAQFTQTPRLSVLEVLELSRRVYSGIRLKKEDSVKIENIAKEFELEKLLQRDLGTLSGGERQKVMIAAAILQEPKVLLLDEPISHLDPKNQLEMLSSIKKITKEKRIITLIVLHDIQHAIHYASRLLMLKNGSLIHDVATKELNPKMLEELFDVHVTMHQSNRHTFIYYDHQH
jgi:iron complex transport system ATP-binding protein